MVNERFGKWYVLRRVEDYQRKAPHYECRCDCGKIQIIRYDTIKYGLSKQCLDCRKKERTPDLAGQQIGKWSVIRRNGYTKTQKVLYECKCSCGYVGNVGGSVLVRGTSTHCRMCSVYKHGMEGTPTYRTWITMKARCTKETNHNYKNYGGRGIKICDRWLNSFENFLEDIGVRPEGLQLDRIDNNGNYEPGNCRWVTPKENSNNRRRRPVLWNLKKKKRKEKIIPIPFNQTEGSEHKLPETTI